MLEHGRADNGHRLCISPADAARQGRGWSLQVWVIFTPRPHHLDTLSLGSIVPRSPRHATPLRPDDRQRLARQSTLGERPRTCAL